MTGGLGSESGVIKVMIDGRSVAFRTTSGNWLGVELIPLESIRQIEIIRGPASALYGADAFLGVVNIITENPDLSRPFRFRSFTGFSGSNLSEQVDAAFNGQSGHVDYLLGAAAENASRSGLALPTQSPSPEIPSYAGNRTIANNLNRRSLVLQGRVGYRVRDTGHLVLSSYLSGFSRGGDFAPWAQMTNGFDAQGRRTGTVVSEGQLRVNLDGVLHLTKHVDLALQSTYFQGGVLPYDRIELGSDLWYARRRNSYHGVDSLLESRYLPSANFNLIVGAEGVYDRENLLTPERINRATDQIVPLASNNDRRVDLANAGIYASSNLRIVEEWLKLTGGLRYDNHSAYGSQITGRVGATSRWSKSVVAKLLYGSAFKAPSPYLLYATPLGPGDVQGNARLKPQKVHTVEYQMSYKPSAFFGVTSGISYSWLYDMAAFSAQGINLVARNTASQRSFAWETRFDISHYEDYAGYLSTEFVRSYRELGQVGYAAQLIGDSNIIYPPYIVRAGLMVAVPSPPSVPVSVGADSILVGPRRASDTNVIDAGVRYDLGAYATLNLFITTRDLYLISGHESRIALRAYNVLGARGPDPGFAGVDYPLAPRQVLLELRHTY
jgi:outer membrane receptor protein involved in Fe transport